MNTCCIWDAIDVSQHTVDLVSTGRKSVLCTYQSLVFNFNKTCSREKETIDSMIILLFPSSMCISNQSIINQNYIENEDLVSTVDRLSQFRVQSTVSWERSIEDTIDESRGKHTQRASPLHIG